MVCTTVEVLPKYYEMIDGPYFLCLVRWGPFLPLVISYESYEGTVIGAHYNRKSQDVINDRSALRLGTIIMKNWTFVGGKNWIHEADVGIHN